MTEITCRVCSLPFENYGDKGNVCGDCQEIVSEAKLEMED